MIGKTLEEPNWNRLFPDRRTADYQPSVDEKGRPVSQRELYDQLKAGGQLKNTYKDHLERLRAQEEAD
jgi:hypothetical protein